MAAAVLSGNRNFEGRIHPLVKANYLASPPLVVAYALAGTTDVDLTTEPLGTDRDGQPVYLEGHLADARRKLPATVAQAVRPEMFRTPLRQRLRRQPAVERPRRRRKRALSLGCRPAPTSRSRRSCWICRRAGADPADSRGPRCSLALGDSVTTDHISPAGSIAASSPAGPVSAGSTASRRSISTATARGAATIG